MSRRKLLLADDSITIQKVVNLTFADQGFDVIAFSDGDSAIENLDEVRPDIVLADVHMPGMNGYQLCELMRSDEANKHTPVVLLVGSFEPFDREEAERVGASAHLTKPFTSIADLVSTVDKLLSEPVPVEESPAAALHLPDTSDIDNLYSQSFVETVEIPADTDGVYGTDGFDDEMIQTSYAQPDPSAPAEESYFLGNDDYESDTAESIDRETESLIARSMPSESEVEPEEAAEGSIDASRATADYDMAEFDVPADEEPQVQGQALTHSDPFESVAADVPVESAGEELPQRASGFDFAFDDMDLLELPSRAAGHSAEYAVPAGGRTASNEIVSLSPELIELIVQKVVERLAEKN